MKTYITSGDGKDICFEGMFIPKDSSNRYYRQFLEELANGEAELLPYTPPPLQLTWNDIILKRDQLLRESDYSVLPDANPETKELWLAYREILRNITEIFSTPESVIWPIRPE